MNGCTSFNLRVLGKQMTGLHYSHFMARIDCHQTLYVVSMLPKHGVK